MALVGSLSYHSGVKTSPKTSVPISPPYILWTATDLRCKQLDRLSKPKGYQNCRRWSKREKSLGGDIYLRRVHLRALNFSLTSCWDCACSALDKVSATHSTPNRRPTSAIQSTRKEVLVKSTPESSKMPGSSGAAGDWLISRLPCCSAAARCRR